MNNGDRSLKFTCILILYCNKDASYGRFLAMPHIIMHGECLLVCEVYVRIIVPCYISLHCPIVQTAVRIWYLPVISTHPGIVRSPMQL